VAEPEQVSNPIKDIAKRFGITFLLGVIIYRLGIYVPVPGIDLGALTSHLKDSSIFQFANMFNGGALDNASIFGLGVMPYISASIIVQILTFAYPALKQLQKEGEVGRRKLNQYTRYLTIAICIAQGVMASIYLMKQPLGDAGQLVTQGGPFFIVQTTLLLTTGSMVLLWLGEQITRFGIGNGVSIIIMVGILSRIPGYMGQMMTDGSGLPRILMVLVLFMVIIGAMVYITLARRRIPLEQQRRVQGNKVYGGGQTQLPLMLNQANVIPVIFASPIQMALGMILGMAVISPYTMAFQQGSPIGLLINIALIVGFTYFYISVTFDINEVANHFKQAGFFVRGIKPGRSTVEYIQFRLWRITFVGAMSLAMIAILPEIFAKVLHVNQDVSYSLLGGTGLLIVVGVGLDVIQKVSAYFLAHQYQGLMRGGAASSSATRHNRF
jgi:preprotein translocase subunit SecY